MTSRQTVTAILASAIVSSGMTVGVSQIVNPPLADAGADSSTLRAIQANTKDARDRLTKIETNTRGVKKAVEGACRAIAAESYRCPIVPSN